MEPHLSFFLFYDKYGTPWSSMILVEIIWLTAHCSLPWGKFDISDCLSPFVVNLGPSSDFLVWFGYSYPGYCQLLEALSRIGFIILMGTLRRLFALRSGGVRMGSMCAGRPGYFLLIVCLSGKLVLRTGRIIRAQVREPVPNSHSQHVLDMEYARRRTFNTSLIEFVLNLNSLLTDP